MKTNSFALIWDHFFISLWSFVSLYSCFGFHLLSSSYRGFGWRDSDLYPADLFILTSLSICDSGTGADQIWVGPGTPPLWFCPWINCLITICCLHYTITERQGVSIAKCLFLAVPCLLSLVFINRGLKPPPPPRPSFHVGLRHSMQGWG